MKKNPYFGLKSRSCPREYGSRLALTVLGEAETGYSWLGCGLSHLVEKGKAMDFRVSQAGRSKVECDLKQLRRLGLN